MQKNSLIKNFVSKTKKSYIAFAVGIILFFLSSVITLTNGVSILKNYYLNSIGYKTQQLENIRTVAPGTNIGFLESKFGNPIFINRANNIKETEYIFINKYFYLQAITDENETVLAFSVTTRVKDFNPTLVLGPYHEDMKTLRIVLGQSQYSELNSPITSWGGPEVIFPAIGFHDFFLRRKILFW